MAIADLFTESFAASEGPDEGVLIGGPVRDLMARSPATEARLFRAEDGGAGRGAA